MLNSALNQATFWFDSMNVLWWVRERSWSFKLFAANRVGEIQSLINRFVPTKKKPADLVTIGSQVSKLTQSENRWNGPDFLGKDGSQWPANRVDIYPTSEVMEIKRRD